MRFLFVTVIFFAALGNATSFAQSVNFEDGFEDGDFTANPAWSGDEGQYTIIDGTPNFLLQLQGDSDNGGVSYLSTPSTQVEGSWGFYVNLEFSPSNGNRTDVFLMSDIADLEGSLNGYALRGGESGSDDVFRIVRYDGGTEAETVLSSTTDISSGGEFRVRVTRQSGGIWTLEVGQGYSGALSQEGETATDNTYTSTSFFGVRSTYTSSRADLFTYDFKIDLPPFTVTDASADGNQIDVIFNQPYDQTTVQLGDFSVDNGVGAPALVTFPSSTVVRLTYGSELASDEYTVSAQEIQAQNGSALQAGASASFIIFADFTPDDVIINEFMYDPPGGQEEYVELKNLSGKFLNLQDWQIGDNSSNGTITSDTLVLRPNDFLAISSDTTALFNVYGPRPYAESGNLPALNNGGDMVQVLTDTGAQVDSLQYTPEWGGKNVALERRSDTAPSVFMENFGDSPNSLGGTPGIANEVADDTVPPNLDDLTIPDNQTLDLAFSERLDSGTASDASNYSLDNSIGINRAQQVAGDSVRLVLDSPLQNGTEYQLTITGQQDIFGNTAADIDTTFSFFEVTQADSGDIFINEFSYDPPEGSTEYIELFNPTNESFDLNGWTINDNRGTRRFIADSQFIVPPDSFVVIAPDNTLLTDNPDIALIAMGDFPSLNNSGDDIVLRRADGTRLDSLQYTPAFGGEEVALERRTVNVPPIRANFGNAPNGFGTPGRQNQIPEDNTPPDITDFSVIGNRSLEFVFTEQVDSESATNTENYAITGDLTITAATLSGSDTVRLQLSNALQNNIEYTATINGVNDQFGNTLANRDTTFTFVDPLPKLNELAIPNNQTLMLAFSEALNEGPANNPENHTLDNGINVSEVEQIAPDSVRLSLTPMLQNGVTYQLSITNQEDAFGTPAGNIDTSFTYFEISQADSGDIFINEFTYDPPEGSTEYIELFNPTDESFDLNGWTINDNRGDRRIITDSRFVVPPDSFVVIAEDNTLLTNFRDINLVAMGSRFPSLNNSGDDIVLRRADGTRLDSLTYTTAFGGNNVATERRTTDAPPVRANFGDAPNSFGTPGSANGIAPDEQPPVLNTLRTLDNTTIQLIFSESITAETATDKANYSISPNRDIQLISAVQDTVTLFLSQELQSGQTSQLTVQNLQDIFGNTINETTRSFDFVEFSNAQPSDVVINEILYSRAGAGGPEFVELFNRTGQNFDLSGWKIGDASNTATINSGTRLPADGYLVITDNASLANAQENAVFLSNFPSLNDDEDAVYIQNGNGQTIDSLFYNANFGGTIDGQSAERIDPAAASNDASNFATSTADAGSTPGAQNAVFMRDETPPSIIFSRIFPNGDIEVRFSEFISITPDLTFTLGEQTLEVDSFNPNNANVIFLDTPSGITPGSELTITAQNLSDVSGNATASTQLAVAQPLTPGDVVINEILFDPLSDSDDNLPDQAEYIELRNIRDYAISIENITLHDAPDEDGEVRTLTPVNTNSKFIPAQGTALVYAEDETPAFDQSKVAQFFGIQSPALNTILQVDRSSLSLASTDDAIYLTGGDGTNIDSVFYDESWQNPNLIDTDGIALERINPFGPSNEESNWGSSTADEGGTPNRENTLFQTTDEGEQDETGISFSSNPFSPDGDGTEDNLLINYRLDQSDYLITVRIYDRYGRQVRELADGRQAGFTGTLTWDGLKDDGTRNRIGIYIIIFKAFDSAGGESQTFKETVVLARRLN